MPSDTFKIIPAGMAPSPGTCCICGFDRRDLVDWGFNAEYYGAVLICVECIQELGKVDELNFVSRADLERERNLTAALSKTIREYEGLRQGLEDGLMGVASNFTVYFDDVGANKLAAIQRSYESTEDSREAVSVQQGDNDSSF